MSHSINLQADAAGNVKYPTAVYLIDLMDNFVTIFFSAEFITRFLICPRNDESAKIIIILRLKLLPKFRLVFINKRFSGN